MNFIRFPNNRKSKIRNLKWAGFLAVLVLLVGRVGPAEAQQAGKTLPRIGFIASTQPQSPAFKSFQIGLQDLGYVDSTNIVIVHRYAEGRLDRMPGFVNELVQEKVDVIVAPNNVAIRAAKKATRTVPIVMISSIDPVAAGYVKSFARPGGNITGLTTISRDLSAKRVELLKDLLPKISRIGVLWDADGPGPAVAVKEYEEAAQAFKLDFRSLAIRGPNPDLEKAFQAAKTARADALVVVGNPLMSQHRKSIFVLATKHGFPSMTEGGRHVKAGGLISYGANVDDLYRLAATYVDKVLKGARPDDLPVMLPEKLEILVNLKTAQQLGLVIPRHLLARADKVIK